jgi:hypothetical protein
LLSTEPESAMSETYAIHWADKRWDGARLIVGNLAACAREILKCDDLDPRTITRIDSYDPDEGWARPVLLDDVARAIVSRAHTDWLEGSGGVQPEVRDFVDEHGGVRLGMALHVIDRAFAA